MESFFAMLASASLLFSLVSTTKLVAFSGTVGTCGGAERYGVAVVGSEIVRLIPKRAIELSAEYFLRYENFRPELVLDGPVDSAVPDPVRPDLLAVLREALSNVVKHARAGRVVVHLQVDGSRLRLTVKDNGVGVPSEVDERSGLLNIRERAARHGGTVELTGEVPSGITVDWTVPLG